VQLDRARLVQADRHGEATGQQCLLGERQGNRFFVAHAILKTAEDRARAQHQLQLLDRVQRVVPLDREEDVIEGTHSLGNALPSRPDQLIADLAGRHKSDPVAGDRLDVGLASHKGDLAAALGQPSTQ
jgi:hypothetical protein